MPLIRPSSLDVASESPPEQAHSLADLTVQLASSDAGARRLAALEMLAHPKASKVLLTHLKEEASATVREAIFTTLARLDDPAALSGLAEFLRSEDANLRNGAIEALKLTPDHTASVVPKLLSDPNSDVRILTISILESLRHPSVEEWLVAVIENDSHLNVCGAALDLLVEVGSPGAAGAVERLKARFPAEPYIQFAANLALKRLKKG